MQRRTKDEMGTYFSRDQTFIRSESEGKTLARIARITGFEVGTEIYRGRVYDNKKVKDIVYDGTYNGQKAVLKVQGVRPAYEEADLIRAFGRQNKSKIVRAPSVFYHESWNRSRGYGFTIMEFVGGKRIYQNPSQTAEEMRDFCRFYQEYATHSINEPFMGSPPKNMLIADFSQVDYWRRICEDKGRLTLEDYAPYVMRYYPLSAKYLQDVPAQFSHGHLFPDHVFKSDDGSYILIDHLSWRYRFRWTDLTMNIWNAWMGIRDTSFTASDLIRYVEQWKNMYLEMPIVKGEKDFEQIFYALMLNRCVGTITADLGGAPRWGEKENERHRKHLVRLMQQLFDYLEKKLEEIDKRHEDNNVLRR